MRYAAGFADPCGSSAAVSCFTFSCLEIPMSEEENTKRTFPPIQERPPFWVEYAIGIGTAYVVGIASIATCENWAAISSWLLNISAAMAAAPGFGAPLP